MPRTLRLKDINGVLDACLNILHFEIGVIIPNDGFKGNRFANQFQDCLHWNARPANARFPKMNFGADLNSIHATRLSHSWDYWQAAACQINGCPKNPGTGGSPPAAKACLPTILTAHHLEDRSGKFALHLARHEPRLPQNPLLSTSCISENRHLHDTCTRGLTIRTAWPWTGAGNVYVADTANHTLRKITPEGMVTTLVGLAGNPGNSDGNGDHARFWNPQGVAVDKLGNIYVADTGNSSIRKVTPAGVVSTLAGNAGSERGANLTAIALGSDGNVYVVETISNLISKGHLF